MKSSEYTVRAENSGKTLLVFLAGQLRISRKQAKRLLDRRRVFVNGARLWMARHVLQLGDLVEIQPETVQPGMSRKLILFEDDHYIIINKPAGILTNGAHSLEEQLRRMLKNPNLVAVHRLDRDTTGCLLFAGSAEARDAVLPLFRKRKISKVYHAIAAGRISRKRGRIALPLEGQPASTEYEVLATNKQASHLRIHLVTGRTHQVRKHLASIHHPVLGDKQYAPPRIESAALRNIPRQMLHAARLSLQSPQTNETIQAKAPLPRDFKSCLKVVGLGD